MDRDHVFRRVFHLCAPGILLYYIFPDKTFGLQKEVWLIIGLILLLTLEAGRLLRGAVFFGMREYERTQISAYAWAGIGIAVAFLLFPMPFVICSVAGLAWTDPLIGELRKRGMMDFYPWLPLIFYSLIAASCLMIFSELPLLAVIILASVGSVAAIVSEKPRIPIDDDFLMMVLPLAAMTLAYMYMEMAGLASI